MATAPTILDRPLGDTGRVEPPAPPRRGGNGGGKNGGGGVGPGPGDSRGSHVAVLGTWVALAPILMLFLAFVSAYVVRQGLGGDWSSSPVPRLLWLNTAVLLVSSLLLERGRAVLRRGAGGRAWFAATFVFGALFVVGQLLAWRQWWGNGIDINTTPHSSFFYLLTGVHAVHLSGGLLALAAAALWPLDGWNGMERELVARITAIYWHFMGILWVGLFLVLSFWR